MKKKKYFGKIIITLIAIVLLLAGIIFYFVYKDLKEEEKFKEEINKTLEVDLIRENVDMTTKSAGDYATVEKCVKDYLNDYSSKAKEILKGFNNNSYSNLLSIQNIQKDGPEFNESIKKLNEINSAEAKIKELIKMASEEEMMSRISKENLNEYYVNLYKDVMFDENTKKALKSVSDELEKIRASVKKIADTYLEAINYLKTNKGKWQVSNNQLYFNNAALTNKYNQIISKLKNV